MFKIVCAWCNQTIKEDIAGAPVSHLICPACYEREMRSLDAKLANASENTPTKPQNPRKKFNRPSAGD